MTESERRHKMSKYKKLYLEITNICNLACSFCPTTKRKQLYMKKDEFSQILDKITGYARNLYFHVKGEPLLHPKIGDFLDISHKKGFNVTLTTNGTKLKELQEQLLSKPAISKINISLQSIQQHNSKKEYMQDILNFVQEAVKRTSINIEFRLWNLDLINIKQNNRNDDILNMIEETLGLPDKIESKIHKGKGIKLIDQVYLSQSYEFNWPNLSNDIISTKGFCYGLRDQIAILVDGTVVPCCLDSEGSIFLGNIFDKCSFEDIVTGERAKKIKDGFSNRKVIENLCQRCSYRSKFDK